MIDLPDLKGIRIMRKQRRIQDFQIEGLGSYRVHALSCYLSLILKHSVRKQEEKKKIKVDQNLEGACTYCAPAWIRHWQRFLLKRANNIKHTIR